MPSSESRSNSSAVISLRSTATARLYWRPGPMADTGPRTPDLPPEFVRLNEADRAWLRGLPDLLDRLARRWSLTVENHFPDIAYNYVAPATRLGPDRRPRPCVLKV